MYVIRVHEPVIIDVKSAECVYGFLKQSDRSFAHFPVAVPYAVLISIDEWFCIIPMPVAVSIGKVFAFLIYTVIRISIGAVFKTFTGIVTAITIHISIYLILNKYFLAVHTVS